MTEPVPPKGLEWADLPVLPKTEPTPQTDTVGTPLMQPVYDVLSELRARQYLKDRGLVAVKISPLSANVYADWLEDRGHTAAANELRKSFPVDPGDEVTDAAPSV